ncbi:MAG TPA: KUP/HAK/KT family potassium transporter, partial [Gammaproteobacteria bacterium]|nr:KUP/HAK/KT family potassium transporter [Gammaproteobacteria bacterium]
WKRGRKLLLQRMIHDNIDIDTFIEGMLAFAHTRVPGTAVFLHATGKGVPHALLHNLSHNKVLHERVVVLTVTTTDAPVVSEAERTRITDLGGGFYRMQLRYGFREEPNIPEALAQCSKHGMEFNMMATSFFLSRETLIVTKMHEMALWREKLFVWMTQNAESAMTFFKLPVNRVLELGTQIEI